MSELIVFTTAIDGKTKNRSNAQLSVQGNTVTLQLAKEATAELIGGSLEVAGGVDKTFKPWTSAVTAQDDRTPLDGDYDNAAGGDFVLPFTVPQ